MHISLIITGLVFLAIGSYYDIRTHTMNVPVWIFPSGIVISLFFSILYDINQMPLKIIIFLLFFLLFMIVWPWEGHLGGADRLAFLMLAVNIGSRAMQPVIVSVLPALPYAIYMEKKGKGNDYPMLPFILAGYTIVIIKEVL